MTNQNSSTRFQTFDTLPGFPKVYHIATETRTSPAYRYSAENRNDTPHCIFQYTLAGHGVFSRGERTYQVPTETGFLCRSDEPGTAYYYPGNSSLPWEFVYIGFSDSGIGELLTSLVRRYGHIYRLPRGHAAMRRIFVAAEGERLTGICASASAQIVLDLLLGLAGSAEQQMADVPQHRHVREACRLIHDNVGRPITAADLASVMSLSREHLTRLFRRYAGFSPYEYIRRRKILYACDLLQQTNLTVTEISDRVGYDRPSHFSRSFRQLIGRSPSEFRRSGITPVV